MAQRQIIFEEYRLDTTDQRLWRGDELVPLRPKTFALLEYLSLHPNILVTKDQLLDAVWPDTSVSDTVLKVCIREIREALSDDAVVPRFIQTVHRRGYRFVASPSLLPDETSGTGRGRTIAVLPLKLVEPNDDDVYLAHGIADALITRLSGLKQIAVRPTSAVRKFAQPDQDPIAAARSLRVDAVVDGTVRRAGDRIRVTAQLIDVAAEAPIWADKFDCRFTDIFGVEDVISEQVARALAIELTGSDLDVLTKRYTGNPQAYELYLKGRYHWMKRTSDELAKAVNYFGQAIATDPAYALAYSGLADCHSQMSWLGLVAPGDALPQARAAALRALELDSLLAEAHTSLAWVRLLFDWDWIDAEREFKRAIQLNSNYGIAHVWYSVQLIVMGRFDEARREIERARAIDPLSPLITTLTGWPFYFMRRYDEAIEHYRRALDLDANCFPALVLLASSLIHTGEFDEAIGRLRGLKELEDTSFVSSRLAYSLAVAGEREEARSLLDGLMERTGRGYASPYEIAGIYAGLGDKGSALDWLEKAFDDRSSWLIFLGVEPVFEGLRGDDRARSLLIRIGLPA